MELLEFVSIASGIASFVLAITAIYLSVSNRKETKNNLDKATEVLNEVERKSKNIEEAVKEANNKMLEHIIKLSEKGTEMKPHEAMEAIKAMAELKKLGLGDFLKEALKRGIQEKGK